MKRFLISSFCLALSGVALAQENLQYQTPPEPILSLALAQRAPSVMMDSKKKNLLLSYRNAYKSLAELNQTEIRLAGLRINPVTNISSSTNYLNNLKLKRVGQDQEIQVAGLPASPLITHLLWSPDEKKIAFTQTTSTGLEAWVIDVATAKAKRISELKLNANLGTPYSWFKDSASLLVRALPKVRAPLLDASKDLPNGPIISNTNGQVSQNRTLPDLLKNRNDERNFETLATSELLKLNLDGKQSIFKKAEMFSSSSFSPDGKFLLLSSIEKPFSYVVGLDRFPSKSIVTDVTGKLVKAVDTEGLIETMPKGFNAVTQGKRHLQWRADLAASLSYVLALDQGDPAKKVDFRDEIFVWSAPFDSPAISIFKTRQRFSSVIWGNEHTAIVSDNWYDTRNTKTYLIDPAQPEKTARILVDRNAQDIYQDPGRFETQRNQYDKRVLAIDHNQVFLIGAGHSKQGQFPFIDTLDLTTLEKKRLYQSTYTDKIETLISIEDFTQGQVLVQLQSQSDYPNYFFRNIKNNTLEAITQFANPFEALKGIHKEVIKYQRSDGVNLSGNLYLPAHYDKEKDGKLPLLIWAYPAEYKDKNSAGQSTHNPNAFTLPNYGSFIYWVTRGYAVLDDAAFPIIGEGKTEPNDNFIAQLVDNADAAIKAVDQLGYIDKTRVAVGGHSYGAFMTANLLTHSKLFACGIARSGAYNRTLTPFGFQSEQRNYWESPEVYTQMSPFMNADKMKTPLLLVHGEADNNPGTFTLQTERYFQALKGLGAPARMVILPKESHGYAAKENILHLLWEQDQFLAKCLQK